ncbi:MAG TPA: helical backbone metal receptor [Candidatus Rubrimentiphilum sp.]|nr:helical backbone metal receptor [Candidatus Rubrimentiphilum sp.]
MRLNPRAALMVLLAIVPAACAYHAPVPGAEAPRPRIVSLIPSLTEDLCAIGAAKQVVGVSQFSAGIPCAKGLPQVDDASSVDAEKVVALHPDLVIGIPSQARAVTALKRAGITVALLPDDSYSDLFGDISKLGVLSGHRDQANALIARLRAETKRLQATEHFARRPSVFVVLQTNPIWTVGPHSYISSLISLAGGRNAVVALPQSYAQFSGEALLRLQPDALLAARDAQLEQSLGREPWPSLQAVRAKRLLIVSDPDLLYRPGPRYNEALSWLIERLRPIAR